MQMYSSIVTRRGQVTIPTEVRQILGIHPGDRIEFQVDEGEVRLRRTEHTLQSAFGSVMPLSRPDDFEALINAAKEARAGRS